MITKQTSTANCGIPILAYHKVDPQFEWGLTRVTPPQFERQIRYLSAAGYRTISLEQCLRLRQLHQTKRSVVITFDDSYESIFTYAFPILKQFNYTATVFVITGFVGKQNRWDVNLGGIRFKHLNWSQLNRLADAGWELGSHSVTHPDLLHCSDADLISELTLSKNEIEKNTAANANFFSYPFNRHDLRVIRFIKEAGYQGACTLNYDNRNNIDEQYQIGRKSVYRWDSSQSFKRKLESKRAFQFEALKQKAVSFCSRGTVFLKNREKFSCNFK